MKTPYNIIQISGLKVVLNSKTVLDDVDLSLNKAVVLAIVGDNHIGRQMFLKCLSGQQHFRGNLSIHADYKSQMLLLPSQVKIKNRSNLSSFYYQQRYNSQHSDDAYTIDEVLEGGEEEVDKMLRLLDLTKLRSKPLIQLSNGENKKVQLAGALLKNPKILILDRPYAGLDFEVRTFLNKVFMRLKKQGVVIVINTDEKLDTTFVDHVLQINGGMRGVFSTIKPNDLVSQNKAAVVDLDVQCLDRLLVERFQTMVAFKGVSIVYGKYKVLDDVSFEVGQGDRLLIKGPNGSGKSTMLSLINGDNPQAFANDITLFDRKKGSGESIWDIKKRIGFFSPEFFLHFDKSLTVMEAVMSGFNGFVFGKKEVDDKILESLRLFNVECFKSKKLFELSGQTQRLVLILRAIIKDPLLLILDEPYQGLDIVTIDLVNQILDAWVGLGHRTLIFVSHFDAKVPKCIDSVLQLTEGKVVLKEGT